ncbi:MAG: hypothetical protein V1861_00990 [Candidatus Micrarchaeota archaeon]
MGIGVMRLFLFVFAALFLFGCISDGGPETGGDSNVGTAGDGQTAQPPDGASDEPRETNHTAISGELIQPSDITYLGAFRLPGASGGSNWGYSGYAATYYPDGDADGEDDGYPGSLFAIGHDQDQQVSEIGIPAPLISRGKVAEDLNSATTLQAFSDITDGMFGELEIPRAGLEYLPPQGQQQTGKLYFSWGQHFEFESTPTHGWAETDLSNPQPAGAWHLDGYSTYTTNDYIFAIPKDWADIYTPGQLLASGRFRDGLWSGRGPALYAYGPWTEGNPPAQGSTLQNVTPLLLYGVQEPGAIDIVSNESQAMDGFSEADEWSGGEWLTAGNKSAVIFVGTKALGRTWYGFSNGVEYPTSGDPDETYPEVPPWPNDQRGWWAQDVEARVMFYDPADLARVTKGEMETWEPQPYATMSIDDFLFDPGYDYERGKMTLVGDSAYDRENGFLYVFERLADEDEKSVVHVFQIR